MSELYLVKELVSVECEGTYARIVFSSFDKEEAIAIAKAHYISNEVGFIRAFERLNVDVVEMPMGHVKAERCIWSATQDLEFATTSELAKIITVKPSFSVLWDNSLAADGLDPINLKYFPHQKFVVDADAVKKHISILKAANANALEWALFDKYEKNVA